MSPWQPIKTAPKDGTWILGFTGQDELYIAMRWWDGFMPDDTDDLSGDEHGEWVGSDDVHHLIDFVTHWMAIEPHPLAPPITTSYGAFDAAEGTECVSRADRGISKNVIAAHQEFYRRMSASGGVFMASEYPDHDEVWASIEEEFGLATTHPQAPAETAS